MRDWLHRHDPEGYALHRAIRVALLTMVVLTITDVLIGDTEVTTFGVFGTFALLLFADFPGNRSQRLVSYCSLFVVGAALICVATLASGSVWLATVSMLVVGTLVVFAGATSAAIASASRALLLLYVLPITVPGDAAGIPPRLVGWAVAAALCIPAALLLWPPQEHDRLREGSTAVASGLGRRLGSLVGGPRVDETAVAAAFADLRRALRATTYRPVTLTTGSRLLLRLADELEWLHQLVRVSDPAAVAGWPPWTRAVVASCARVLQASGEVLGPRTDAAARSRLDEALTDLAEHRRAAVDELADELSRGIPLTPDQLDHHTQRAHAWVYTTDLVGRTAAASAAADARPMLMRMLGRGAGPLAVGPVAAAGRIAAQQFHLDSVWLQNSLRTGVGLAVAVLAAQLSHVQHGFWVVLGAMSVLRTSALATTSTVLRALLGTVAGFAVGGVLVAIAPTGPVALWIILPIAVLVAAFAPNTVSFAAGQAAFTVTVVVLFNILVPVGWKVGLVRVQDVAIGCAASLVVGLLLWPGGAAARVRRALADAYRSSADLLHHTVHATVLEPLGDPADGHSAQASSARLDSALRQYLAERGVRPEGLETVTAVINGVGRLRLSAEAIEQLTRPRFPVTGRDGDIADLLLGRSAGTQSWFHGIATALESQGAPVPDPLPADTQATVVTLLGQTRGPRADPVARRELQLAWVALFLDDAATLSGRLGAPVATLCLGTSRRTATGADHEMVDARRDGVANGT
ncbi:FUSC family protein [Cellulomonas sp. McL0617]|uniref:FUSC family protein n=1 Tax=Cellulomonas sp. McL0617 TaxID=3415675 RepID=UPI003CE93FAE